jgi:uncharacterized protein (TIGR03083 family)
MTEDAIVHGFAGHVEYSEPCVTSHPLTALTRETQALSAVLHELGQLDLTYPTCCRPWTVQELVVHIATSLRIPAPAPVGLQDQPRTAADYYRRAERNSESYRRHDIARVILLTQTVVVETPVVQWFDEAVRKAIGALSRRSLDELVVVPGVGAMRLAEWVITCVISVAAHGLDVAMTLERPAWTTPAALEVMHPVFVEILGVQLPEALGWDDETMLASATGRRVLTVDEAELLGPYARRFPLLT